MVHDTDDHGLDRNLLVVEQCSRRASLLHDEHTLANADADHIERDDLRALFLAIEVEPSHELELLLAEILVSVRGDDVSDYARDEHLAGRLARMDALTVDVHPV